MNGRRVRGYLAGCGPAEGGSAVVSIDRARHRRRPATDAGNEDLGLCASERARLRSRFDEAWADLQATDAADDSGGSGT